MTPIMRAFAYYQGVFRQLVYDNLSSAVKKILRSNKRVEQERFVSFRSYYTYEARFCNPGLGREKGGVEGLVGFARRNFLVPLPRVKDFEELNQMILERCRQYSSHRIAGREDRSNGPGAIRGGAIATAALAETALCELQAATSAGGSLPDGASGPQSLLGAQSVCGSLGVGACELLAGRGVWRRSQDRTTRASVFQLQVEARSASLSGSNRPAAWIV